MHRHLSSRPIPGGPGLAVRRDPAALRPKAQPLVAREAAQMPVPAAQMPEQRFLVEEPSGAEGPVYLGVELGRRVAVEVGIVGEVAVEGAAHAGLGQGALVPGAVADRLAPAAAAAARLCACVCVCGRFFEIFQGGWGVVFCWEGFSRLALTEATLPFPIFFINITIWICMP